MHFAADLKGFPTKLVELFGNKKDGYLLGLSECKNFILAVKMEFWHSVPRKTLFSNKSIENSFPQRNYAMFWYDALILLPVYPIRRRAR